jgi:DNA-binding NarL/FixJ family response regulator
MINKKEKNTIPKIKIFLVDDHRLVRRGIKSLLNKYYDFEIIGEADSGEEALEKIQENMPEIILMDVSLPGMNGFETVTKIKELFPKIKALFLSMHDEAEYIIRSIKSGGDGYILKSAESDELINAIRNIISGEKYYSGEIAKIIFNNYNFETSQPKIAKNEKCIALTQREKEILRLVSDGYSAKEIAEMLFISPRTVETHRLRIMQKLEAHNTAELIKLAVLYKLIEF